MLKRPSELISQSNFKWFHTASDTYRSLQSFCNFKQSAISYQLSAVRQPPLVIGSLILDEFDSSYFFLLIADS
jgi:hypothetical protein